MVTRTQISLVAMGTTFRPSTINAPFSEAEDPGTIGSYGPYRGVPVPMGSVSFDVPETEEDGIAYLHRVAFPLMPALRAAGATDIWIHITYHYCLQCTLGFSSEETRMLADFDCPVSIDAYPDGDGEAD